MLVLGLFVGYIVTPLISHNAAAPTNVAKATTGPQSTQSTTASLKDAVIAQTRHFTGTANAPVTIVEFGDFQ